MEYFCKICDKKYKTYQSLWNHNNKFHQELNIQIINDNKKERPYKCIHCNMGFTRKNTMKFHIDNRCKRKKTIIEQNNNLKTQVAELQKTVLETKNIQITNVSTKQKLSSSCNYIYLIEKFDVNNNHFIYKFGKTNRPIMERIKEHCLSSKILLILKVDDCNLIESNILKVLNSDDNITREKDIGNEYFYCNDSKYIIDIILKNLTKNDEIVV